MIVDLAIVLASILVLIASAMIYRLAAGDVAFGKLNMLSYAFYVLLFQGWSGAVIVTMNREFGVFSPVIFNRVIGERAVQVELWAWLMWMMIGVPLGALMMNATTRTHSMTRRMANYRSSPLQIQDYEKPLFSACAAVGVIILAITGYRLYVMGDLPLLNILKTGDVDSTLLLRRGFRVSTGFGTEVLSSIFSSTVISWMSYVAYAVAAVTKLSRWRVLFAVTFISSILLLVVNTTISPMFIYLLGFMIVRSLMGLKVFRPTEVAVALGLLVLMQIVFKNQDRNILHVLQESILGRIMTGQLLGFYMTRNVFPDLEPFIGFASTGTKIHELMGLPISPSYGILTMLHYNAMGVEAGTAGHMTTIFMGEAWANFGYIGLVIAPLWVGAFVQAMNLWFISRPKTMVNVGLYAALTTTCGYHMDLISFYYPAGTILFLLGVTFVLILARFFGARPGLVLGGGRPGGPPFGQRQRPRPAPQPQ